MNVDEARESLAFSEHARKRARDDVGRPWLALVLLGSLSVASLSLTDAAITVTGLLWVFAGPLGAGAITLYAYRRNRSIGIDSSPAAYAAIAVGILILAYAVGWIGYVFHEPSLARVGPAFIVVAGYLVLAWIERKWTIAAVSLALLAVSVAIIGLDLTSDQSMALLFSLYGVVLLAVGFNLRAGRQQLP